MNGGLAGLIAALMIGKSMRPEYKVVFTGGGAKNILLKELLSKKLNKNIYVPKHPQMIGAFGAALAGKEMEMK